MAQSDKNANLDGDEVAVFKGLQSCADCHDRPSALRSQDFVTLRELDAYVNDSDSGAQGSEPTPPFFGSSDKHAQAYLLLKTELGKQITDRLEWTDTTTYDGNASKHDDDLIANARACLTCHANWREDTPPSAEAKRFVSYGVTCESCHGASSLWEGPHDEVKWRTESLAKKKSLGMIDVRNPVDRAKQCYSCHIGDAEQGKVVTHEMYAAGHPPLPGFEVEMFASEMPPHWRYLPEKGDFAFKKEYLEASHLGDGKDLPRTKAVILGSIMAWRASINLLAGTAQFAQKAADGELAEGDVRKYSWPEFAVFDCQSCHHDLKSPSQRQASGDSDRRPGRPRAPTWPKALVALGKYYYTTLFHDDATRDERLANVSQYQKDFEKSLDERPFGDPQNVVKTGNDLSNELDALANELSSIRFDRSIACKTLSLLPRSKPAYFADYHSARQIVWAMMVIEAELTAAYPNFPTRSDTPAAGDPSFLRQIKQRGEEDLAIYLRWKENTRKPAVLATQKKFQELFDHIRITIPAGEDDARDHSVSAEFPQVLKEIADYDPDWFGTQLKAYANTLPKNCDDTSNP